MRSQPPVREGWLFPLRSGTQTFSFYTQSKQMVSLDGKWRFHSGDDARWAAPNFDDAHWSLLRSNETLGEQGYKGYSGFGWYRFRIRQIGNVPLSLLPPHIRSYYQIFVNGKFVAEENFRPTKSSQLTGPSFRFRDPCLAPERRKLPKPPKKDMGS